MLEEEKLELPQYIFQYLEFINLFYWELKSSCWLDALRIRGLRILLFPVVAPLILLGWVLYVVGDRQAYSQLANKKNAKELNPDEKPTAHEAKVEMGLIDEILEEQLTD